MRHVLRLPILLVAIWVGMAGSLLFGVEWGVEQLMSARHIVGTLAAAGIVWAAGLLTLIERPEVDRRFGTMWTIVMFIIGLVGGSVVYNVIYALSAATFDEALTTAQVMARMFLIPGAMTVWISVVAAVDLSRVVAANSRRRLTSSAGQYRCPAPGRVPHPSGSSPREYGSAPRR